MKTYGSIFLFLNFFNFDDWLWGHFYDDDDDDEMTTWEVEAFDTNTSVAASTEPKTRYWLALMQHIFFKDIISNFQKSTLFAKDIIRAVKT